MVSIGFAPIEDRVDDLLDRYKIEYVIKTASQSKHNNNEVRVLMQIFVPDQDLENILIGLQKAGVGVVAGTGFSLLPTTVNIFGEDDSTSQQSKVDTVDSAIGASGTRNILKTPAHHASTQSTPFKQYKIEKFYKSIKSRLIVAEVIKRIEGGAEFSFDFV